MWFTGSDSDFPYTQHKINVSGVDLNSCNMRLLKRIDQLTHQKAKIEDFIYGIENSLTRQIFELRYIKGKSWERIALELGGGNTADGVRMAQVRYFERIKKKGD